MTTAIRGYYYCCASIIGKLQVVVKKAECFGTASKGWSSFTDGVLSLTFVSRQKNLVTKEKKERHRRRGIACYAPRGCCSCPDHRKNGDTNERKRHSGTLHATVESKQRRMLTYFFMLR